GHQTRAFTKRFAQTHSPAAAPHESLQAAPSAIREEEQMPTHWIFAETVAHQPVQAVESFPHIYTLDGDVDLGCWPQPEHHAPSTTRIKRANSASPNRQPLSIRRPLPSTSAKSAVGLATADSKLTRTNRSGSTPLRRR